MPTSTVTVADGEVWRWVEHPIVQLAISRSGGTDAQAVDVLTELHELLQDLDRAQVSFGACLKAMDVPADLPPSGTRAHPLVAHAHRAGMSAELASELFDIEVDFARAEFEHLDRVRAAVQAVRDGEGITKSARMFGLARDTVTRNLDPVALDRRVQRVVTPEKMARAVELFEHSTMSIRQIAKEVGLATETLASRLRAGGYTRKEVTL